MKKFCETVGCRAQLTDVSKSHCSVCSTKIEIQVLMMEIAQYEEE